MKKKEKKFKKLKYILIIVFIGFIISLGTNKFLKTDFDNLPKLDRQVIEEYDKFQKSDEKLWKDYRLEDKDILIINKNVVGNFYLLTKDKNIKSIFAKKIKTKEDKINIYRISKLYPKRFEYLIGNFNTKDKNYKILGKDNIFYVKYDKDSINKKFSSLHFLPFLSHEALHYYMQKDWDNITFRGYSYNDKELDLLDKEYKILGKIKNALDENADVNTLKNLGKEYLKVMDERFEKTNPEKIQAEIFEETMEGAANYVSIKAAKIVGYDYGILYFDNTKNVKFDEIVPTIKKGQINQSIIGEKIVYESGALLCQYLDKIEVKNWQEKLNNKGKKDISLYSIIKENLN